MRPWIRRTLYGVAVAALYAGFSYGVMPPKIQWRVIQIAYNVDKLNDPDTPAVVRALYKQLDHLEAAVTPYNSDETRQALDRIRARQKDLMNTVTAINAETKGPQDALAVLRTEIDKAVTLLGSVEKNDRGEFAKQIDALQQAVEGLKNRATVVAAQPARITMMRTSLTDITKQLGPMQHKETGLVALVTDINQSVVRIYGDLDALERGTPGNSSKNGLGPQIDALESSVAEIKRRHANLQSLAARVNAIDMNLKPLPVAATAAANR